MHPAYFVSASTFHLGFLLSTALFCGTIHMMIVIVNPDLKDEQTRRSWASYLRFFQFFIYLPLLGYLLSDGAHDPATPIWFLSTVVLSVLFFVPLELRLRGEDQKQVKRDPKALRPGNPSEDSTPQISPQQEYLKNVYGIKTKEDAEKHFKEMSQTHLQILLGNFSLGLLMGFSILLPFLFCSFVTFLSVKFSWIDEEQAKMFLKFIPGLCSLTIPFLMPFSFLLLGPSVLRITQRARSLKKEESWKNRWEKLCSGAQKIGLKNVEFMDLLQLPWAKAGFRNAFYLGVHSKRNPFLSAVFLVQGLEDLLSPEELDFVISHEMAHGASKHGTRRMTLGIGIFFFFVLTQVIAAVLKAPLLSLTLAIGSFIWGYFILKKQGELQEYEADTLAVKINQSTPEAAHAAINALKKLDEFNLKMLMPQTQKRILILEAVFLRNKKPDHSSSEDMAA